MRAETELLIVDDNSRDGSGTSKDTSLPLYGLLPEILPLFQVHHVIARQN